MFRRRTGWDVDLARLLRVRPQVEAGREEEPQLSGDLDPTPGFAPKLSRRFALPCAEDGPEILLMFEARLLRHVYQRQFCLRQQLARSLEPGIEEGLVDGLLQ